MAIFDEFKKFIARGSVLDLAVGVMIGAAFGKIVTSLTENVIMPIIGWAFGDIDFSQYFVRLGDIPAGFAGNPADYAALKSAGVAMIGYGEFITQVVNFLIIAAVLFLLVRSINKMVESVKKEQAAADATAASEAPTDPQLDALKDILAELRKAKA